MSFKNQKKIMVIPKKLYVGFTLMEMLIVIIIVGLLAAIALPNFSGSQERVFGKEANATLKLISAAEKNYRMESNTGSFYGSTDIRAINENLTLSLTEKKWDYNITTSCSGGCFNITAQRNTSNANYRRCTYWLWYNASATNNADNPSCNSTTWCP